MKDMQHRYSTIYDYYKCNRFYELKHIKGLKDDANLSGDMAFGTAIHLAIDDLFDGGTGVDVFNTYWETVSPENMNYSRLKHADLADMGPKLIEIFRDEHMKDIVPLHREKRIECEIQGVKIAGTPDCIGEYKGVLSVIDYKTSAMPYDAYKIVTNEQMPLYAAMSDKAHNVQPVQGVYAVLVKDPKNPRIQIRKVEFTKEFIDERLNNFISVCKEIESKQFFPKNPLNCKSYAGPCFFYENCYNGKKENK